MSHLTGHGEQQEVKDRGKQTWDPSTERGFCWTSVNGSNMFSSKQTGTAVCSHRASRYTFLFLLIWRNQKIFSCHSGKHHFPLVLPYDSSQPFILSFLISRLNLICKEEVELFHKHLPYLLGLNPTSPPVNMRAHSHTRCEWCCWCCSCLSTKSISPARCWIQIYEFLPPSLTL